MSFRRFSRCAGDSFQKSLRTFDKIWVLPKNENRGWGENRGKPHWILWWTTWWPMDHGRRFSSSPIFGENFGRPAENNIIYFVCMQRYREARRPPRAARYGTKSYCTNHAPQCAEKKKMGRSTRTRGPYAAHTCRARRAQRGEREGGGQQNDAVNSRC